MPTINKNLQELSKQRVDEISIEYLMGWHDLCKSYGFRLKGFNHKRVEYGLPELTTDLSTQYRIAYIKSHYDSDTIASTIFDYAKVNRLAETRWSGIDLFDCHFGKDYAKIFKALLGSTLYRKLSEQCRLQKIKDTSNLLYGGVGLAGDVAKSKAAATNMRQYGVENPMQDDGVKARLAQTNIKRYGGVSPFSSENVRNKAMLSKITNIHVELERFRKTGIIDDSIFKASKAEQIVFHQLISRFGKDDVYYAYGLHPYDARYPYNCDFYIKSLDLFIELNLHYSHGNHWFDETSKSDVLRLQQLKASSSKKSRQSVTVWAGTDVAKRAAAKAACLNYLVFWDNYEYQINKQRVPRLDDFGKWFNEYECDTQKFLNDNSANTY